MAIHIAQAAHYPGLFKQLLEELGFINFDIGENDERLTCTDPTETVFFEFNHCPSIPSASFQHVGIVSKESKARNKAMQSIKRHEFTPIKRPNMSANARTLLCIVRIPGGPSKVGAMSFEVASPRAHG